MLNSDQRLAERTYRRFVSDEVFHATRHYLKSFPSFCSILLAIATRSTT